MTDVHLGRITIRGLNGVGIMNGACGASGSEDGIRALSNSGLSAVVVKTSTVSSRKNSNKIYMRDDIGSLNVYGLENPGLKDVLPYERHVKGIPCIFSVMCSPAEVQYVVTILAGRFFELNVSCPNVASGYSRIDYVNALLYELKKYQTQINGFGIKLPLFFSEREVDEIINIFSKTITPDYVVCGNTLPGVMMDGKTPVVGGIGGKYLMPFALNNVRMFSNALEKAKLHTAVVGCGGISTGADIYAYVKCGATAVQLVTYLERGENLIRLQVEYGNCAVQCKL